MKDGARRGQIYTCGQCEPVTGLGGLVESCPVQPWAEQRPCNDTSRRAPFFDRLVAGFSSLLRSRQLEGLGPVTSWISLRMEPYRQITSAGLTSTRLAVASSSSRLRGRPGTRAETRALPGGSCHRSYAVDHARRETHLVDGDPRARWRATPPRFAGRRPGAGRTHDQNHASGKGERSDARCEVT